MQLIVRMWFLCCVMLHSWLLLCQLACMWTPKAHGNLYRIYTATCHALTHQHQSFHFTLSYTFLHTRTRMHAWVATIVKTYFRYCKYPFGKPVYVMTKSCCVIIIILLTNDYKILYLIFLKTRIETVIRMVITTTMVAAKIEPVIRNVLSTAGRWISVKNSYKI